MSRRAALALIVVLPLAVGLPLREKLHYYATHRAREALTTVPAGGAGTLNHASWRLRSIRPAGDQVEVVLEQTALDQEGTVQIQNDYQLRDRSGRRWELDPVSGGDPYEPGERSTRRLRGRVPADVTGQVEFVMLFRPAPSRPGPLPGLRFRR
ncbi:hypothetical protein [Actinoallomurus sp. NPDC052274]|uniref:hypothetical protein n=1 Tax=Actinoallomurus sp. NPDC052274 TaxID=3155420 RepID=UPI0034375532